MFRLAILTSLAPVIAFAGPILLTASTSASNSPNGFASADQPGILSVTASSPAIHVTESGLNCFTGPPVCSETAFASANSTVSYGQIDLAIDTEIFDGGDSLSYNASCGSICGVAASASGSFADEIVFFGGTGTMKVNFQLLCTRGACGAPFAHSSAAVPSQITFGVPFDISASATLSGFADALDDRSISGPGTGNISWGLFLETDLPPGLEYTTASGQHYATLDGRATFITPEPRSTGFTFASLTLLLPFAKRFGPRIN